MGNFSLSRIFAGTAVICNYLLMISWLPASIAIQKHFSSRIANIANRKQQQESYCSNCYRKTWLQLSVMIRKSWKRFHQKLAKIIAELVMNYSSIWCTIFGKSKVGTFMEKQFIQQFDFDRYFWYCWYFGCSLPTWSPAARKFAFSAFYCHTSFRVIRYQI